MGSLQAVPDAASVRGAVWGGPEPAGSWNQWAWERRRYGPAGLLVLGSDNNMPCEGSTVGLNSSQRTCSSRANAILESGMDNSPMYYNAFDDQPASFDARAGRLQLYDCQQSALFVSESLALRRLGEYADQSPEALQELERQANTISAAINAVLWDNQTGIYRQADALPERHGRFSQELSPTSFYPMIAGVASPAQAARMIEHLVSPNGFCVSEQCPYGIPSIYRGSPHFRDNTYWRGRTWGPTNLLTWLGLAHPRYRQVPGVRAARERLVAQSYALLMVEWRRGRRVHENYNSTSGAGGDVPNSNPFYHWGSNLAWIAMREAMLANDTTH